MSKSVKIPNLRCEPLLPLLMVVQVLDFMTSQMAFYQVANGITQSMEPRMDSIFNLLKTV